MTPRILLLAPILFLAADAARVPAREIPSAFLISKSENKNQVHFAVGVDDACKPLAPNPVRPYWRMLERSPTATEPLSPREENVYGVQSQDVRDANVTIRLRALSSRPITISTWRDASGACTASATTAINGKPARLYDVHVVLGPIGVRYALVTGWAPDGSIVRETVSP